MKVEKNNLIFDLREHPPPSMQAYLHTDPPYFCFLFIKRCYHHPAVGLVEARNWSNALY